MKRLFSVGMPLPLGLRCSMRALLREKREYLAVCISDPLEEWSNRSATKPGRSDTVSDEELLAFRKARAAAWRKKAAFFDSLKRFLTAAIQVFAPTATLRLVVNPRGKSSSIRTPSTFAIAKSSSAEHPRI
ncbi:MAG: hypothetical protein WDN28_33785 [Chthoniobacter sp.]